jgi:hypothetical protein
MADDLPARLASVEKALDILGQTIEIHSDADTSIADQVAKLAVEVGLISRAVSFLGLAVAANPSTPPGIMEDLLESVLGDWDEASRQKAERTVNNLRMAWRSPPDR